MHSNETVSLAKYMLALLLIAIFSTFFLTPVQAQKYVTLEELQQKPKVAFPKMILCMEAAYAAEQGFEMKQAKKKLVYPQIDDYVIRLIIHRSMWIGYNSKTSQEAIQRGHDKCAESKIWNEINLNKEIFK